MIISTFKICAYSFVHVIMQYMVSGVHLGRVEIVQATIQMTTYYELWYSRSSFSDLRPVSWNLFKQD